jgi:hypothetical protein
MGSSGTGNFGDYTPTGEPRCDRRIDAALEEVALGAFFSERKDVPHAGERVRLRDRPEAGRLVVEETASRLVVGLLPTSLNYLIVCFTRGYQYEGFVTASRLDPIPSVQISLVPLRP